MFPGAHYIILAIFVLSALLTVAGALIAVLTTRVIRSVCGLAICCLGLAGLYYFLHSPFLALMEVLIYIGAVCITIVFAIMLAEPDEPAKEPALPGAIFWTAGGLLASGLVFWGLTDVGLGQPWQAPAATVNDGSLRAIGISLLTTYSLAFELISLVLLVAILGALAIARMGRSKA